jgi:hypothetical protein
VSRTSESLMRPWKSSCDCGVGRDETRDMVRFAWRGVRRDIWGKITRV